MSQTLGILVLTLDDVIITIDLRFICYFECFSFLNSLDKNSLMTYLQNKIKVNINSNILNFVLLYCNNRHGSKLDIITRPFKDKPISEIICNQYDLNYVNSCNFETLCDIISACELLQFEHLMDICLCKLSIFFRDSPIENIKDLLNIKSFDENDYLNIIKDNQWLMEMNEDRLNELNG